MGIELNGHVTPIRLEPDIWKNSWRCYLATITKFRYRGYYNYIIILLWSTLRSVLRLHVVCVSVIRYDTIEEINVDSKAEYTA